MIIPASSAYTHFSDGGWERLTKCFPNIPNSLRVRFGRFHRQCGPSSIAFSASRGLAASTLRVAGGVGRGVPTFRQTQHILDLRTSASGSAGIGLLRPAPNSQEISYGPTDAHRQRWTIGWTKRHISFEVLLQKQSLMSMFLAAGTRLRSNRLWA